MSSQVHSRRDAVDAFCSLPSHPGSANALHRLAEPVRIKAKQSLGQPVMLNAGPILLIVLVGLASASAPALAQLIPNEYRLKAAFVYQFTQFVEWPAATWQEARTLQLCVAEPNPFGSELEQLVRGESLNGRPLSVKEIFGADEVDGCHVLYVSAASGDASVLLKVTTGRPILTVGEADLFLESGGVIAMKNVDGRVRFEVSAVNAQKGGLQISSQLLSLAIAVRGGLE